MVTWLLCVRIIIKWSITSRPTSFSFLFHRVRNGSPFLNLNKIIKPKKNLLRSPVHEKLVQRSMRFVTLTVWKKKPLWPDNVVKEIVNHSRRVSSPWKSMKISKDYVEQLIYMRKNGIWSEEWTSFLALCSVGVNEVSCQKSTSAGALL